MGGGGGGGVKNTRVRVHAVYMGQLDWETNMLGLKT
jgi:hypothetical protein